MLKREALAEVLTKNFLARSKEWVDPNVWIGVYLGRLLEINLKHEDERKIYDGSHLRLNDEGWETRMKPEHAPYQSSFSQATKPQDR